MAETTGIGWTDATFNPWMGCTKVGPACDLCYAENLTSRRMGLDVFGVGKPRQRTSLQYWGKPLRWEKLRAAGVATMKAGKDVVPVPLWVFCASLADVFDNEVPPEWREDLWQVIRRTPHLRWQLVTKRVGNVVKMLPADWQTANYDHVGIIATVCNQAELERDIGKLLALKGLPIKWVGLSIEPQIARVSLKAAMHRLRVHMGRHHQPWQTLDWAITGGESQQRPELGKARPYDLDWALQLIEEGRELGIPVFVKQVGSNPVAEITSGHVVSYAEKIKGAGTDPAAWPAIIRVQQMPRVYDLPRETRAPAVS